MQNDEGRPKITRTFVDSGVLIAAVKGKSEEQVSATKLLGSRERIFLTSPYVRLEVFPKAAYHQRESECNFYLRYFDDPRIEWLHDAGSILRLATLEAERSGLSAMDSLHVAAAHMLQADEFITTERVGRTIYRTGLVPVFNLFLKRFGLP